MKIPRSSENSTSSKSSRIRSGDRSSRKKIRSQNLAKPCSTSIRGWKRLRANQHPDPPGRGLPIKNPHLLVEKSDITESPQVNFTLLLCLAFEMINFPPHWAWWAQVPPWFPLAGAHCLWCEADSNFTPKPWALPPCVFLVPGFPRERIDKPLCRERKNLLSAEN